MLPTVAQSRLLTPGEVAEILRVSEETVLRMLRAGELRGIKVGRQWRIPFLSVQQIVGETHGPEQG